MSFIPYGKQYINDDDIAAVIEVLHSDWLTTGPKVGEFEIYLAEKVGSKYAVVFNSGTAALHASYFAAGISSGCEVITSPITFAATANAALYLGGKPVFVDVNPNTINIDPEKILQAISNKTKVIAPVDFAGHPCQLNEIRELAANYGIITIEDAAHSLGATYNGKPVGSISDMTIFSFHPVKHITTGEGGAVTTNNKDFYQKLISFRSHGIAQSPNKGYEKWHYEMQYLGFNYRLTDIQCALGISQLKKLDTFVNRRKEIAQAYFRLLSDVELIELPTVTSGTSSSWHLFVVKVKKHSISRVNLFNRLRERGLGVQVHYIPVYWHPYYRNLGYMKGACPIAEDYYSRAITIPIYPAMTNAEIERVAYILKEEVLKLSD